MPFIALTRPGSTTFPTIATLALLVAGCASSPNRDPTGTVHTQTRVQSPGGSTDLAVLESDARDARADRTMAAPAVAVFDQLPAAFQALGVAQVGVVDTSGGVYTVGVRNLLVHGSIGGRRLSTYLDCGTGGMGMSNADRSDVYLTLTAFVTPSGTGSSVLHSYVAGQARDPSTNAPPVRCVSTRAFEARLAEQLARLVQQPATP